MLVPERRETEDGKESVVPVYRVSGRGLRTHTTFDELDFDAVGMRAAVLAGTSFDEDFHDIGS